MIFNPNVSFCLFEFGMVHIIWSIWYGPYDMDHILSEFGELEKSAQNLFIQYYAHVSVPCTCEKITCTSDCLYFCALFYKRKKHDRQ